MKPFKISVHLTPLYVSDTQLISFALWKCSHPFRPI